MNTNVGSRVPLNLFGLLLGIFLVSPSSFGGERMLRVANFNIRGLNPVLNKVTGWGGDQRFERITNHFNKQLENNTAPDFLVLNEVFSVLAKSYVAKIKYPYRLDGDGKDGKLYNSGVVILSQHPIQATWGMNYDKIAGLDKGWAARFNRGIEGLANKGVFAIRAKVQEFPTDILIYGTHLVAQTELDKARENQVDQIADRFMPQTPYQNLPVIWSGDFNFKPKHQSYHHFRDRMTGLGLPLLDAGQFCSESASCEKEYTGDADENNLYSNSNDRQFWTTGNRNGLTLEPKALRLLLGAEVSKENTQPLSDHFEFLMEYRATWGATSK